MDSIFLPAPLSLWSTSYSSRNLDRQPLALFLILHHFDGKVMSAPVTEGANFDVGAPVPLFQANPRETVGTSEQLFYDVSRDGQRFLINTEVMEVEVKPMTVVLNWAARLNK